MHFLNIGSGSKGNSTIIYNEETTILVDVGVSRRRIVTALKTINKKLSDVQYVLITHAHSDHISNIDIFPSNIVYSVENELRNHMDFNILEHFKEYRLNTISVIVLLTSHDVKGSCGFLFKDNKNELVYITDTGFIPLKTLNIIQNKDIYIIESNHDINMLLESRRTNRLKERILSSVGHLSNDLCAQYLAEVIGEKTKAIFLAHLSEECNLDGIAIDTVYSIVTSKNKRAKHIVFDALKQKEATIYDQD